eukprot:GEZU01017227.1.p1 GENE.GEZU01017227.1~~GEZU01017227.1.p1  ORF type:complete len:432 (-),score=131.47 GEZU01017227.1:98-1330(-)
MVKKERIREEVEGITCGQWCFLTFNVFVNIVLTIITTLLNIPYAVQVKAKNDNASQNWIIKKTTYNDPWAVVFIIPAALMGLAVFLFRFNKYLRAYHLAETVAAWIQGSMGVLTIMHVAREGYLSLMFPEGKENPDGLPSTITFPKIYPMMYVSLLNGFLLVVQSVLMFASATISSFMCKAKIADKYDRTRMNLELNRDAKIMAATLHLLDAIIGIGVFIYVLARYWIDDSFSNPQYGEIAFIAGFAVVTVISIIESICGFFSFLVTLISGSTARGVTIVFITFNFMLAAGQLAFWVIMCIVLTIYAYLVSTGSKEVEQPIALPFYHALYGFCILGVFKVTLFLASITVHRSNTRLAAQPFISNATEFSDVKKLRKILGIKKDSNKSGSSSSSKNTGTNMKTLRFTELDD